MKLEELKNIDTKDMKLGYVYVVEYVPYTLKSYPNKRYKYLVCIGKTIVQGNMPIVVELKPLQDIDNITDSDGVLNFVKSGKFENRVEIYANRKRTDLNDKLYCIGKLFKNENEINSWIAQLKLCGYDVYMFDVVKYFGYIGDWKKRKKLPCVSNFVVNDLYIKESLAFVRRENRELLTYDYVWCYIGTRKKKGVVVYVWDEISVGLSENYLSLDNKRGFIKHRHEVQHQYKDMVRFDRFEWKQKV
jgi:hypothetical protein